MEIARSIMKADACSLLLLDEETNELAPPRQPVCFSLKIANSCDTIDNYRLLSCLLSWAAIFS